MAKEIEIPCSEYTLKADWYEGQSQQDILFVMTGYSSNKSRYVDLTETLVEQTGYSALVLDYSGHGESPGHLLDLMPAQNVLDVITTFDWIGKQYPESRISVVSCSYGGYLSAYLAQYRDFHKLVMRAPAIYAEQNLYRPWRDYDRKSPLGHLYREDIRNFKDHSLFTTTKLFTGPTLLVQHELDTVCPKVSTDEFAQAFNAETWVAAGFEHSFKESDSAVADNDAYKQKIVDWLLE